MKPFESAHGLSEPEPQSRRPEPVEGLIFEKSVPGRRGVRLPKSDVPEAPALPPGLRRAAPAELPEVSELDAVRHFTRLSQLNFSVDTHFYPLGSCTMKYNPKLCEQVARLEGFAGLHPLLPQLRGGGLLTQGALAVLFECEQLLCRITGMARFTLQPLAGAHGELTGIMIMAAFHRARGKKKSKVLVPDSSHGTNPASAAIAGYQVVSVPSDRRGRVDLAALKRLLDDEIAGLMMTCPNTLGLFEEQVGEIARCVHEAGGLMYYDGANLNAIVGKCRPGDLGFDIVHLNLHKTFATPHGSGGPGAGPVGVTAALEKFLPISLVVKREDGTFSLDYDRPDSIGYIAPFYGNFGVILRAYAYILSLGREGLIEVAENAVLNANYLMSRLARPLPGAVRRPLHARVRPFRGGATEGLRLRRERHRQGADRPRLPPADDLFPAHGQGGDDDRADGDRIARDARRLRRRDDRDRAPHPGESAGRSKTRP